MKRKKKPKQKRGTLFQQITHLVAETHRIVHEMRQEQIINNKNLRKSLQKLEEQMTPKEIASPKDKIVRYK